MVAGDLPFWTSMFLGLLQGSTELFPVSSLGHAVLLPSLLHLDFRQSDETFVPYLVLLHLGTAAALVVIYRREWVALIAAFARAAVRGELRDADERLVMMLAIGTVPAGVAGVVFETRLKSLFATPRPAAIFLICNAGILLGAEMLRRRSERRAALEGRSREEQELAFASVDRLSFRSAILVGACQALALLPGISRSGVTMAGGLLAGLRHEEAVRFSFLLATPIIAAAGALEVPQLFNSGVPVGQYALGAVLAGLAAYASARFLIRYFRVGRLDPYAYYCATLGLIGLIVVR
jgi:undecaprenyl-diphosphatase